MKTLKFYAVNRNTDSTEGRGRDEPFAFFKDEASAVLASKDKATVGKYGVMGVGPLNVSTITIDLFESFKEYRDSNDTQIIRERALAKLSIEERQALGL